MRYLQRTPKISVAWLHERLSGGDLCLRYETSEQMAAEYTHMFTDAEKWVHACKLVNIVDPDEFLNELAQSTPPHDGGGMFHQRLQQRKNIHFKKKKQSAG